MSRKTAPFADETFPLPRDFGGGHGATGPTGALGPTGPAGATGATGPTGGGGGGVTPGTRIDGLGPPANIIGNRASLQSPIDSTQTGIVNIGSDTSGVSTGVTGEFSSNLGGDGNATNDPYCVMGGGQGNSCFGPYAFVGGGLNNTAGNAYATVPGGNGCSANGTYSFACGSGASATGNGSVAMGFGSCDGDGSFAVGTSGGTGDATTASGNLAFTFATGVRCHSAAAAEGDQFVDTVYDGVDTDAAGTLFTDYEGNSLSFAGLPDSAITLRATLIAGQTGGINAAPTAIATRLLVYTNAGALTISKTTVEWTDDPASNGYAIDFAVDGLTLTATLTGAAEQIVAGSLHYEFVSVVTS